MSSYSSSSSDDTSIKAWSLSANSSNNEPPSVPPRMSPQPSVGGSDQWPAYHDEYSVSTLSSPNPAAAVGDNRLVMVEHLVYQFIDQIHHLRATDGVANDGPSPGPLVTIPSPSPPPEASSSPSSLTNSADNPADDDAGRTSEEDEPEEPALPTGGQRIVSERISSTVATTNTGIYHHKNSLPKWQYWCAPNNSGENTIAGAEEGSTTVGRWVDYGLKPQLRLERLFKEFYYGLEDGADSPFSTPYLVSSRSAEVGPYETALSMVQTMVTPRIRRYYYQPPENRGSSSGPSPMPPAPSIDRTPSSSAPIAPSQNHQQQEQQHEEEEEDCNNAVDNDSANPPDDNGRGDKACSEESVPSHSPPTTGSESSAHQANESVEDERPGPIHKQEAIKYTWLLLLLLPLLLLLQPVVGWCMWYPTTGSPTEKRVMVLNDAHMPTS